MKLSKLTIAEIENFLADKSNSIISIEEHTHKEKLKLLNELLIAKSDIKIVLIITHKTIPEDCISRMDIFNYLPNLQNVSILCHSNTRLDEILELNKLSNINSFSIAGFIKPNISFEPLQKFKNIKFFKIDDVGLTKSQSKFIDTLNELLTLEVQSIDLGLLSPKLNVQHVEIYKSLSNENLFNLIFPSTRYLKLSQCKKLDNFNFLNDCSNLVSLNIYHNKKLKVVPILQSSKYTLTHIELMDCNDLQDITALSFYENLQSIRINSVNKIVKVEDLKSLQILKSLRFVDIGFYPKDIETYKNILESNSWTDNRNDYISPRLD